MDAAYNLARWLMQNDHDAEDIVQEAFLRAYKFFGGFRGGDSRAWLFTIVRNTSYNWLRQNRKNKSMTEFNEEIHVSDNDASDPESILSRNLNAEVVRSALEELDTEFREVLVLRELEGCSYKEIAHVVDVPIGTVMSRLARARKQLERKLAGHPKRES